jgi:hypothetical protein
MVKLTFFNVGMTVEISPIRPIFSKKWGNQRGIGENGR